MGCLNRDRASLKSDWNRREDFADEALPVQTRLTKMFPEFRHVPDLRPVARVTGQQISLGRKPDIAVIGGFGHLERSDFAPSARIDQRQFRLIIADHEQSAVRAEGCRGCNIRSVEASSSEHNLPRSCVPDSRFVGG